MTVNRLVVLIGSILGLIGIVAWIGELDLGLGRICTRNHRAAE